MQKSKIKVNEKYFFDKMSANIAIEKAICYYMNYKKPIKNKGEKSMKKKVFILAILTVILACLLAACTNDFKVSKKGHDAIIRGSEDTYIAVEDGKSYLYSMKNSKKLTKKGFDELRYLDSYMGDICEDFLFARNDGEIGHMVINQKGEPIIASTTDMKIVDAYMVQDFSLKGESTYIEDKFIAVDFLNDENRYRSAAFNLNGSALFYDKNSDTNFVFYQDWATYTAKLNYVVATSVDSETDDETRVEIFDGALKSIYAQDYNDSFKHVNCNMETNSSLGFVENKRINDEKTTYHADIIAGNNIYEGYTTVLDSLRDDKGAAYFYVAQKENTDTGISTYHLVGQSGEIRSFDSYSISYGNLLIPSGDKTDVINYKGETILSNAEISGGYYYITNGDTKAIYNLKGKKLFDTATTTFILNDWDTFNGVEVEYYNLSDDQGKFSFKFFRDGVLTKEYDDSFILEDIDYSLACAFFSNQNDSEDREFIYCYDYASNIETLIENDDPNIEVYGKIDLGQYSASYYVNKESSEIVFISGITGTIAPYKGDKVPSYSIENKMFSIEVNEEVYWLNGTRYKYLEIVYEALSKVPRKNTDPVEYDYQSRGEVLYAYYMINGIDSGSGLVELYSGYNAAKVYIDFDKEIIVASTVDHYANLEDDDIDNYKGHEPLEDKTRVFEFVIDKETSSYTLKLLSEFNSSNVEIASDKYLMAKDFLNYSTFRNSVYNYEGTQVLEGKYEVSAIEGDLAVVEVGGVKGLYNLNKGKIVEDIKHHDVDLLNANLYGVVTISKNGLMTTLKDGSGKKIVANCYSYEYLNEVTDFVNKKVTVFYTIYLGKGQVKILSVTYDIQLFI